MAMTKNDKLLVEAIKGMLRSDAKLGLAHHDDDKALQAERGFAYLHEQIEDMFAVKAAELVHADGVCQAFTRIHNYKYLDDPEFPFAVNRLMVNNGIPAEERQKAINFIPRIIEELMAEQGVWAEKDSGFNPSLDEVKKVSQPEQPLDFQIQKRSLNERNVDKPKRGDGSPARVQARPPLPGDGYNAEVDPGDGEGN